MDRRRLLGLAAAIGATGLTGCVGRLSAVAAQNTGDYERATVVVRDEAGTTLARVRVRLADTQTKRFVGLSDTASLGEDEGMLFIHDSEGEYAYVMRDMDFPLDIVFADADGLVTTIHHAPLPPEETGERDLARYRGRGKYVLEVPYDYTTDHCISAGDRLDIQR